MLALYLVERGHELVDIKPYSFRLSWKRTCCQDSALSSKSGRRTSLDIFKASFLIFGRIRCEVLNGGCYFYSFTITRQTFSVVRVITNSLGI